MKRLAAVLATTLLLSSCAATYQVESPNREPGKQALLNIRRVGLAAVLIPTRVYANGAFIGQMGPGRYISVWLPSGEYLLNIKPGLGNGGSEYYKVVLRDNISKTLQVRVGLRTMGHARTTLITDPAYLKNRKPPRVNYSW
jgi:hypothetical protein